MAGLRHVLYRNQYEQAPKDNFVTEFPTHVDLENTSWCNFRCVHCFYPKMQYKKGFMAWDDYTRLVDEMTREGALSLKFQWRGEPTLDKLLVDRIRYAKEAGIHEVMFNSNASLLGSDLISGCITAGLDRIIISVDGVSKEVYEKIRINGTYERLVKNLTLLKEMSKGTQLKVRIQGVLMRENAKDMEGFTEHWEPFADELFLRTMYNPLKALNQGETKPGRRCPQTWQRLTVGWDLICHPCCAPWESTLVVGNANNRSLKEIWHGKATEADMPKGLRPYFINMNKLRKMHRDDEANKVMECSRCGLYDVRPGVKKEWDSYSQYKVK